MPWASIMPADLDRAGGREAGIGVGEQRDVGPQRLPDGGNDRLAPARPFVPVAPDLGADPELEGVEALLLAQPPEALGLGLRRDVALHRGGVGAQRPGRAAEKLGDRLAGRLAPEIPDGGVEPAHGAPQVGAGELVLALGDQVEMVVEVVDPDPERPRRHLPVQHQRGDVGIVGRDLAPAGGAGLVGDADEADMGASQNVSIDFSLMRLCPALLALRAGEPGALCARNGLFLRSILE